MADFDSTTNFRSSTIYSFPEENYLCVVCDKLLSSPVQQLKCGDRVCGLCYSRIKQSSTAVNCPGKGGICCETDITNPSNVSLDYEVARELKTVTVKCYRNGCSDQVLWKDLEEHLKLACKFNEANAEAAQSGKTDSDEQETIEVTHPNQSTTAHNDNICSIEPALLVEIEAIKQHRNVLQDRILALEKKGELAECKSLLNELNIKLEYQDKVFQEVEEKIKKELSRNFDGKLVWKVQLSALQDQKQSPPFYTSQYGYKMCLNLFFNRHLEDSGIDVRFGVMKGDYDPILHWPFKQEVSLQLFDTEGKIPVSKTFKPDPTSASAQRPVAGTNIFSAKAATLHIDHSNLKERASLITEGCIFIGAIVDVNVPKPPATEQCSGQVGFSYDSPTALPSTDLYNVI